MLKYFEAKLQPFNSSFIVSHVMVDMKSGETLFHSLTMRFISLRILRQHIPVAGFRLSREAPLLSSVKAY